MKYNHIKRFLSAALLIAFTVPSGIAPLTSSAVMGASSMTLSGDVKLTERNDQITLSLRDSDVKQVLRMFADKVGKNIVFHQSVNGKVTLDLVNEPINDAFNLVLQIAGLSYYIQNNTLIIMDKNSMDNAAFSKQEMMIFPVRYVDASKVASFLNKNVFGMKRAGMSGVDAATVNSATNEIIVFGMPSDAEIVQKVIDQLDREPMSKTFAVNHTTPAEMASMICEMLLPSRGSTAGGSSSSKEAFFSPSPGVGTGGAAGIMTGGAASTDSGSGIKLGEGTVACSIASSASSAVASSFDVQNLSVSYFTQRGTVTVIGGSPSQQQMIERFIKDNDVKQPQAYLEVSIVELNETGSKEFNNTWEINSRNWNFAFDPNTGSTEGGRIASPGTKKFMELERIEGDSKVKTFMPIEAWYGSGTYISWTMNYLITNGKGRVLANPKLLITNGQESIIDLTQDYVEKVTSEFLSSNANGEGATGSVQKTYSIGKDQGIKISLTPFISPDGYVTMNIKPEYATEAEKIYANSEAKGNSDVVATLLSRRNLDLKNVRIKDGETLAIGGLIQEIDTKTVAKIPVLGDLPVIGSAFRSSKTKKQKSELVIMITPRIINDGEGSVADSL